MDAAGQLTLAIGGRPPARRFRPLGLTPPDGLSDDALVRVLGEGWGLAVASIHYRPVGFGSHHWEVVDIDDLRWFVSVDVLDRKRQSVSEPRAAAFDRLRAALATVKDLRDSGATFVSGTPDGDQSWEELCSLIGRLPA